MNKSSGRLINILLVCLDRKTINTYTLIFKDLNCNVRGTRLPFLVERMVRNYKNGGHPFDIIFLDYILDKANGISLAIKIREIDPDVLLMLFPTRFLKIKDIQEDYDNFGGFFQPPDVTFAGLKRVIDKAIEIKTSGGYK